MDTKIKNIFLLLLPVVFLAGTTGSARGFQLQDSARKWSASLEAGSTWQGSAVLRLVGAYWLPKELKMGENGVGTARAELDLGVLDTKETAFDGGLQPVFRYEYRRYYIRPYVDLGAGVHFLSRANIRDRQLGAAFQFSLLAGGGLSFKDKLELGYRFFHLSNADIHSHNNGRDEHLVVFTYLF